MKVTMGISPQQFFLEMKLLKKSEFVGKAGGSKRNASTVAIDNKIEQAMDLVKSHLMFAVREEVEVLKEQIKELTEKNNILMEKNSQLEYENNILKGAAAPETLAELQVHNTVVTQPSTSTS